MGHRQPPVQQAPPVQRLRLRYAKRGPARFTSHRDFGRALERALRRAEIPMAYSSGFTPHPRISYANAAPTSAASEAEYVELGLAQVLDPAKVLAALNEALPQGFVVLAAAEASKTPLGELLQVSDWQLQLTGAPSGALATAATQLLGATEVNVERMTKSGVRSFDVRAAVLTLKANSDEQLTLRLRHLIPAVRPDDVLVALRRFERQLPPTVLLTRLRQGPLAGDEIADPLAQLA